MANVYERKDGVTTEQQKVKQNKRGNIWDKTAKVMATSSSPSFDSIYWGKKKRDISSKHEAAALFPHL